MHLSVYITYSLWRAHVIYLLLLPIALLDMNYYYSHLSEEDTEIQRLSNLFLFSSEFNLLDLQDHISYKHLL